MNAKSHQYLSLQPAATAEKHSSQGWHKASLKREDSFAIPQGWNSQTILAPQPVHLSHQVPTVWYPQLCAFIQNYRELHGKPAHTSILEVLPWKAAVPSSAQLNREETMVQVDVVCCCPHNWWCLQTADHFLSWRKQSTHIIQRSSSTPPHMVDKRI